MMRSLLILFLLLPTESRAQPARHSDSLFLVSDYLLNIKRTVGATIAKKEAGIALDSLTLLASQQKRRFEHNLPYIARNRQVEEELTAAFDFIIRSLILYKTDLRNNAESTSEMEYMYRNIPVLVDKIYYYCKIAQKRSEE